MQNTDLSQLHIPARFWVQIVSVLDKKLAAMAQSYGFGAVKIELVMRNGEIKDVVVNDEVRIRVDELVKLPDTEGTT